VIPASHNLQRRSFSNHPATESIEFTARFAAKIQAVNRRLMFYGCTRRNLFSMCGQTALLCDSIEPWPNPCDNHLSFSIYSAVQSI